MKPLDIKDKKILHLINKDARISLADISRETNTQRNVVKAKLLRLEREKIIKSYKLNLDYKLLGFEEYEVYLRLSGVDNDSMEKIIKSLIRNKNVSWIGVCFGNYDIKLSLYAKNNQDFHEILNNTLSGFKEHIKAQEIVGITKKYKMDTTLFLSRILKENFNPFFIKDEKNEAQKTTKRIVLSLRDKKIINYLSHNSRATLSELSKETNMTVQGVKNRFDALLEKKIILGTKALINGQTLGFIWATCLFKLNLNEEQEEILERYILGMSGTTSAVRLIGRWDLGITFFSESTKDLQKNINDFKSAFKDSIKDYDSLIILDSHKYPSIPECVLE
jgi:Lrp/AsnC family transcriptional regulator, leucine-responsive regulatory protein